MTGEAVPPRKVEVMTGAPLLGEHSSIDNMPPIEREAMYSEIITQQGAVA